MKNTIATLALFVFLISIFPVKISAYLPPVVVRDNIKIVAPTATPTPLVFKKIDPNINLKLIPTIAPGAKLTVTPEPTLGTKLTVTPEPTLGTKLTVTPSQTNDEAKPSIEASKTTEKTEENTENKPDLKMIFTGITLGLLVLIILIQLWPRKKEDQ